MEYSVIFHKWDSAAPCWFHIAFGFLEDKKENNEYPTTVPPKKAQPINIDCWW
jgi:hypothetical protein